jgi:hypothetical protein
VGRARSTHVRGEKIVQGFGGKFRRGVWIGLEWLRIGTGGGML